MIQEISVNRVNPKQWVEKYADYLYNFAFCRINDENIAKDLVQETFLAALEKFEKFEGRSSEKTWLVAIIKNKIIDIYRKQSNYTFEKDYLKDGHDHEFFEISNGHWKPDYQPKELISDSTDPLINKELKGVLTNCLQKLPKLWLSVFTLKHIDDETSDFICKELKVSPSNFWVIIHRTKVNLRACLEKNWI